MTPRSYGQNCGLARAMDVLGERWTVLIVRELGMGPRRYKDLVANLPGIGTNLLAARLRSLEETELVERTTLPAPASVPAYRLTEAGEELRPILGRLAAWGVRRGAPFQDADESRLAWLVMGVFSSLNPDVFSEFGGVVQVQVGPDSVWIGSHRGAVQVVEGDPPNVPLLIVRANLEDLLALAADETPVDVAIESGLVIVEGTQSAVGRFLELCGRSHVVF